MKDKMVNIMLIAGTIVFVFLFANLAFGEEHPNTVVTFCEVINANVFCEQDRYWHIEGEVIQESETYSITLAQYKEGLLNP